MNEWYNTELYEPTFIFREILRVGNRFELYSQRINQQHIDLHDKRFQEGNSPHSFVSTSDMIPLLHTSTQT